MRWEWFYYGRSKTLENRYFEEFTKQQAGPIVWETNAYWYTPNLKTTSSEAAVEIL